MLNSFHLTGLFLYSLKTYLLVFWCCQGLQKETSDKKSVKNGFCESFYHLIWWSTLVISTACQSTMQKLFKNTKNNHERMTLVGTVRGWQKVISQFSPNNFFLFLWKWCRQPTSFPYCLWQKTKNKKIKNKIFFSIKMIYTFY